jgi:hypothetical protein
MGEEHMNNLMEIANTIKSTELVEIINTFRKEEGNDTELDHKNFMAKIRKEIETLKSLGLDNQLNFKPVKYKDKKGELRNCFELNRDGMLEMLNSESAYVRYKTIEYINKLEEQLKQPACMEDVLIQSLKGMKEIRLKAEQATQKAELANTRIDNLDCTNIQGTPQQRLNAMIRKYSYENGIIYSHGWEDFRKAYNTAYHTNVVTKCHNYCKDNHIKKLSIPAYLTRVGLIEDALRVADKMLNSKDIEEVI